MILKTKCFVKVRVVPLCRVLWVQKGGRFCFRNASPESVLGTRRYQFWDIGML